MRDLWAGSKELWAYREAAATLASFDFEALQPFEGEPSLDIISQLLADCDVVHSGPDSTLWSLRTPIRKTALSRLFKRHALQRALEVNPDRNMTQTQRVFERYIRQESGSSSIRPTAGEAAALLEVSYWLEDIPELNALIPQRNYLRALISREQLLGPFQALVGDHFAGRQKELNILSDYVGLFDATTNLESAHRFIERIFNIEERPPLFVLGPGGGGKSTLIAKFILEHAEEQERAQFPFAYLDFDRPALTVREPVSLLIEIMRQLSDQYPESKGFYTNLVARWTARIEERLSGDTPVRRSMSDIASLWLVDREQVLNEFAEFTYGLGNNQREQPMLLVLDTFEEIQFRSSALEDEVFDFLNHLQQLVPRLRTVLCGRTPIATKRYKVTTLPIGDFDDETALVFLTHHGIIDRAIAEKLVGQVGRSPLVLRLAAEVARMERIGDDGISELGSRWLSLFRRQRIEVVLYKRILSHVYDKRVEQLAYPGLVLRYITPDILLTILAPTCGVSIVDNADAEGVFAMMRSQLSTLLMTSGSADKLEHRTDMRKILIEDLAERSATDSTITSTINQIHLKAIEYYARTADPEHRAEEIFHRLALGQDRETLKERWMDGLSRYLNSAIQELPAASQSFLAARIGVEVPEQIWRSAVDEDWIQLAIRRSDEFLRLGKPQDALELLSERKEKLWVRGGLLDQAYKVVDAILSLQARTYEKTRLENDPGNKRTRKMEMIMSEVRSVSNEVTIAPAYVQTVFRRETAGDRIVAIVLAQAHPFPAAIDMAIEAIGSALSPFEQFHALVLVTILKDIPMEKKPALRNALLYPSGTPFHPQDSSRLKVRDKLLAQLPPEPKLSQIS